MTLTSELAIATVSTSRVMALRPRTPQGQGSLARNPMPIVRPAGCAS